MADIPANHPNPETFTPLVPDGYATKADATAARLASLAAEVESHQHEAALTTEAAEGNSHAVGK